MCKIAIVIPRAVALTGYRTISGDFTRKATLVPIPNTIVKLAGPMIVPKGVKVGHRRSLSIARVEHQFDAGFFVRSPIRRRRQLLQDQLW